MKHSVWEKRLEASKDLEELIEENENITLKGLTDLISMLKIRLSDKNASCLKFYIELVGEFA